MNAILFSCQLLLIASVCFSYPTKEDGGNPGSSFGFFGNSKPGSSGVTCIKGTVTTDLATDEVLFDDTKSTECSSWANQCYTQTVDVDHSDGSQVQITIGGCWNPIFKGFIDTYAEEINQYMGEGSQVTEFDFTECQGSDCNDFTQDTAKTIQCYNGLTVTAETSGNILFSDYVIEECRVNDYCETVTVYQSTASSGQSLRYEYSGCGDPADTRYKGVNVVPYVPTSTDEVARMQSCFQYDFKCTENYLGFCQCNEDFMRKRNNYATMSEFNKQTCDQDLCNKGPSLTEQDGGYDSKPETAFDKFDESKIQKVVNSLYGEESQGKPKFIQPGGSTGESTLTCMKGTATTDMESGKVLYDDSKSVECEYWANQCYRQTVNVTHPDSKVQTTTGGCWNKAYRHFVDTYLEEVGLYLNEGSSVSSYLFESCEGSDCFQLSPQESEATITCYSGLQIDDDSGTNLFKSSVVQQCKITQYCQTVTTQQTIKSTQQKLSYKYTGCGDPADTTYKGYNVLPYIPPSTNEVARMRECANINYDCTETYLGLCLCKSDFPQNYAVTSEFVKKICFYDLCNSEGGNEAISLNLAADTFNNVISSDGYANNIPGDFTFDFVLKGKEKGVSGITCMKGTITKDLKTNTVLYDDVQEKECNYWATECGKQTMTVKHPDREVQMLTGSCWNAQFDKFVNAFENERDNWVAEGATVTSFVQESCSGSNCFDFTEDTELTLTCYNGLTVTDAESNKVLYSYAKPEQCKVYSFCETNTIVQTTLSSSQTLLFQFSGCGDPTNSKYDGLNILPYIPPSLDDVARMQECAKFSFECTETYLGLCVCKRGFDVSRLVAMSDMDKETCEEDLCNE